MAENKQKIRLDEVTLMRCILALLIVFMHSFTCYNGSWRAPKGFVDIPLYKWIARTSFAFTLEAFVLISGYLFAFQRITLNRIGGGISLIFNKLKRLMLPSIIFSILYFVIFYEYKGFGNCVYSILNGCGHMWFLPMLFWCFIGCWILLKLKCKDIYKLTFLAMLNLCVVISLPLRISSAAQYVFYFYGGYCLYQYRENISNWITGKPLCWMWLISIVIFAILRPMRDFCVVNDNMPIIKKALILIAENGCQLIYASVGAFVFYCTALWYVKQYALSKIAVVLSGCCFGIYLFQQFILQLLYYKTTFPILIGPYWLPWIGFGIAFAVSLLLTKLFLKTKTGKFLIG